MSLGALFWMLLEVEPAHALTGNLITPVFCNAVSGYRFYDPNLQLWLNRDPIEEDGGMKLYGFVKDSPINYLDLFGLIGFSGNCYQYAINVPNGGSGPNGKTVDTYGAYPGIYGGEVDIIRMKKGSVICSEILRRIKKDFSNDPNVKEMATGDCQKGYHKIRAEIDPNDVGFHFKRQDPDSRWSEISTFTEPPIKCNPKIPYTKGDKQCPDTCVPDVTASSSPK